jgi:hypothetical protein
MTDDNAFDLELAATTMLGENRDVRTLLKALVSQLAAPLGDRLQVDRQGGFLRKSDEIKSVRVSMSGEDFEANVHGTGVTCTVGHSSGGIRIRSETVGMDQWLRRLLVGLQAEAAHSQATRQALENIVIGGPE